METVCSSETLVFITHESARRYNPEEQHRYEASPYTVFIFLLCTSPLVGQNILPLVRSLLTYLILIYCRGSVGAISFAWIAISHGVA
jgi:hypothetical protein